MADEVTEENPRKRIRLDKTDESTRNTENSAAADLDREMRLGISSYVNKTIGGFAGILKQRYTDFLVNEVLPSGQVLHLDHIEEPKKPDAAKAITAAPNPKAESPPNIHPEEESVSEKPSDLRNKISDRDKEVLAEIFGDKVASEALDLHQAFLKHPNRKKRDFRPVKSEVIDEKDARTRAHQEIRRIFLSSLETVTSPENRISILPSGKTQGRKQPNRQPGPSLPHGRLGWEELGGEYLHFTLYKENRDTMEVISHLANRIRTQPRTFQFSGTKDRRGVTVQRVSAYRVSAEALKAVQHSLRGAKIGGIKHEKYPLSLGQLGGNEFHITLRDCHFPGEEGLSLQSKMQLAESTVTRATESLRSKGFINYYGLQRFGSFDVSTDAIGKKLLQGDTKVAVELILQYPPSALAVANGEDQSSQLNSDECNRALAINIWQVTGNVQKALEKMPRRYSAEVSIIRHLGQVRGGKKTNLADWQGALGSIQRSLRLMYVHAYQSLIWNSVASFRWERYGDRVVEGDLVITTKESVPEENEVDDDGEVIIRPADQGTEEHGIVRARPLAKEEAEGGNFTIWDVVLPLPGYDVCYPANDVGQFYSDFMKSEQGGGLDPHNMRRKWKDISLSGGYRRFLARPAHVSGEVRSYFGDTEQLVETDLDRLLKRKTADSSGAEAADDMLIAANSLPNEQQKIAVILKMQLGSGQYATMALREMLKAGGVKNYQPEFRKER